MGDSSNKDEEGPKHLPDDLVVQHILPCLPIKPLTQFKVLSKQMSSSLSSSNFILKHTKQPLFSHPGPPVEHLFIQCNNHYLLYSCVNDDNVVEYDNCIQRTNFVQLDVKFAIDVGVKLVGSSKGLVCLAENYGKYFFLYNPMTNQSHKYYPGDYELINYNKPWAYWGFGHVSSVNDYKVVRIMRYCGIILSTIHVFSLNSNCWRKIESDLVDSWFYGRANLVNETLYWAMRDKHGETKTLAFNLESETFHWFHHLKTRGSLNDVLCVMGGCLSRCGFKSVNEGVLDIMRGPGRVISLSYACPLRIDFEDEVIGFTKTGKVFVAHTKRAMISLIDQNSKRTRMSFGGVVGDVRRSTTIIQSYVPSETSPLPATEMPTSSTQGTWATSYEGYSRYSRNFYVQVYSEEDEDDDSVEEVDVEDDPVEDVDVEDDPIEDVVVVMLH